MTPKFAISAPMHPWSKVAMPVAVAAVGGAAAYGLFRATDDERSAPDRIVSGALGVGAAVGATILGGKVAGIGYRIKDAAAMAVRDGADYATYPWPKHTAVLTQGNGTWYIPPQVPVGDALEFGGLAGGFIGGTSGLLIGVAAHGERN